MFTVGMFFTNCYVVNCEHTKEAVIIDPGFGNRFEAERIFRFIDENELRLRFIVNTHGHPDHTCGNAIAKQEFNVPILIHEHDAQMLGKLGGKIAGFFGFESFSPPADVLLQGEDLVSFGKIALKVMPTPGHSPGSISLLGTGEVFTGDTLFSGSIGRIDFPGSSEQEMNQSLKNLSILPDHFIVYPGHGPKTAILEEKHSNPFLQGL